MRIKINVLNKVNKCGENLNLIWYGWYIVIFEVLRIDKSCYNLKGIGCFVFLEVFEMGVVIYLKEFYMFLVRFWRCRSN